jgi:putative addiction module killer protein
MAMTRVFVRLQLSYVHHQADARFDDWIAGLCDRQTRVRLLRRLEKAQRGLLGDVASVGGGVSEMREFFGPGWRMYYVQQGDILIVMLGGGDKGSQQIDIAAAQALAATLEE